MHVSRHKFRERQPDLEIAHSCISPAKYVPERDRVEENARKHIFFPIVTWANLRIWGVTVIAQRTFSQQCDLSIEPVRLLRARSLVYLLRDEGTRPQ